MTNKQYTDREYQEMIFSMLNELRQKLDSVYQQNLEQQNVFTAQYRSISNTLAGIQKSQIDSANDLAHMQNENTKVRAEREALELQAIQSKISILQQEYVEKQQTQKYTTNDIKKTAAEVFRSEKEKDNISLRDTKQAAVNALVVTGVLTLASALFWLVTQYLQHKP